MGGLLILLFLIADVLLGGGIIWVILALSTSMLGLNAISYGVCCLIFILLKMIF